MFMSIESTIKGSSITNTDGKGHECGKCNANPCMIIPIFIFILDTQKVLLNIQNTCEIKWGEDEDKREWVEIEDICVMIVVGV